jgi:hypothetical protein
MQMTSGQLKMATAIPGRLDLGAGDVRVIIIIFLKKFVEMRGL